MKKVFFAIAAIAMVACFSSCNKTCICKNYVAGVVVGDEWEAEVESGKKCSDLTTLITQDPKTGVECHLGF